MITVCLMESIANLFIITYFVNINFTDSIFVTNTFIIIAFAKNFIANYKILIIRDYSNIKIMHLARITTSVENFLIAVFKPFKIIVIISGNFDCNLISFTVFVRTYFVSSLLIIIVTFKVTVIVIIRKCFINIVTISINLTGIVMVVINWEISNLLGQFITYF